jgi:hypothetical protein
MLGAACGRPFLVAAKPRLAPVVERSDWLLQPLEVPRTARGSRSGSGVGSVVKPLREALLASREVA